MLSRGLRKSYDSISSFFAINSAVDGMICISPIAPLWDTASWRKLLSALMMLATNAGHTSNSFAAARISDRCRNGNATKITVQNVTVTTQQNITTAKMNARTINYVYDCIFLTNSSTWARVLNSMTLSGYTSICGWINFLNFSGKAFIWPIKSSMQSSHSLI